MAATTWSNASSVSTSFRPPNYKPGEYYLLLETGDNLLQETGDSIYLEAFTSYADTWSNPSRVTTVWT